jgi:hypothetical protein
LGAEALGWATLGLTGVSLAVAAAALWVALVALGRSDKNASAGTVVTLNQGFADAWRHFQDADGPRRDFEFAELMNTFEIAAAIHQEGSLHGVAEELIEDYLCSALEILDSDADARTRISKLRDTTKTFRHLVRFRNAMKARTEGVDLLPTMEPSWSKG